MEQHEKNEVNKLAHEITRLITRVDYQEKEIIESKRISDSRFARLEEKLDSLGARFDAVSQEVRAIGLKIGFATVIFAMAVQIFLKHFNLI